MASIAPQFLTGANAKIKIDGKTMAYASDLGYRITVDTIPIETIGRYEAVTHEPVNYSVSGSFTIVRYTAMSSKATGAASTGNGLGAITTGTTATALSHHIDPGNLLLSKTFDINVYQKVQAVAATGGAPRTVTETTQFITITDCRVTGVGSNLTKRGIVSQEITFVGILADDDSFNVSNSGGDTDLG